MSRTRILTGLSFTLAAALVLAATVSAQQGRSSASTVTSLYDLTPNTLMDEPGDLGEFRGQVTLVVNVASKCGFTPQYEGLEALHRELKDKGFSVLGFPSNDFGGQEPGSAQEIADFCRLTYDVTFPMFEKVVTQPGPEQSPVYAYLGQSGQLPAWNFGKYVIGRDGTVVAYFPSNVAPDSLELRAAIVKAFTAR